jgi:hypothetical protein
MRTPKKPLLSRKAAYGVLFALALSFAACLMWFAIRAMADANPWFSGIGIAAAVVCVIVVLARENPLRSFKPPQPDDRTRPKLRIVKK